MQQTLLVLLGIIILALYGLSFQQQDAKSERESIRRELETAALGVTASWSARLQRLAFDDLMVGKTRPVAEDDLRFTTPVAELGSDVGESTRCDWDDLDDFHGFVDTTAFPVRYGEADFRVEISVRYADAEAPETLPAGRSNVKAARVTSTYVDPRPQGEPYRDAFRDPVRVSTEIVLSNSLMTVQRQMQGASLTGNDIFPACSAP